MTRPPPIARPVKVPLCSVFSVTSASADRLTPPARNERVGLAVGPDGPLYVSNRSVYAGQGTVLRIEP